MTLAAITEREDVLDLAIQEASKTLEDLRADRPLPSRAKVEQAAMALKLCAIQLTQVSQQLPQSQS